MSLEAKQIHPAVQKALFRKIDALNRIRLGTNKSFYTTSTALDAQKQSNPIEQQMARMCWARLTAAVIDPDKTGLDGLNDQPIYFSSYIQESQTNSGIENANRPLTYNKESSRLGENQRNIYRGETGITSVQVDQLSFFVKKMTISFACPDPIDFEKRIQPIFLRHGQYCAVEFGWGMNDSDVSTPKLSFDDIQKLNSSIKERNLASAGNYQCDVGIVSNYTFSLNTDGGYEGTIDILTRGQNILNQTSQNDNDIARDVLSIKSGISDLQLLEKASKTNPEDVPEELEQAAEDVSRELKELQQAKITFKRTMGNLENVLDDYLKRSEDEVLSIRGLAGSDYGNINNLFELPIDFPPVLSPLLGWIHYKFKNGVLRTKPSTLENVIKALDFLEKTTAIKYEGLRNFILGENDEALSTFVPDNRDTVDNYFVSWGWFEDHILNSFFSIKVDITTGKTTQEDVSLQSVRSVNEDSGIKQPNKCHIAPKLFTKGLDTVILPGKTHESIRQGMPFRFQKWSEHYNAQLKQVAVRGMFEIIDKKFKPFVPDYTEEIATDNTQQPTLKTSFPGDAGIIRNMVFPIGKFKEHFTNMETLKQGLRSFWADVSNQYGNFWQFGIAQDQNNTGRIGIYDQLYNPAAQDAKLFVSENQSSREDFINYKYAKYKDVKTGELSTDKTDKIFNFPLYSKDSIVKNFSLQVKISSKAATIAVYGGNTNVATGTQRSTDYTDVSLQAYSLLLNSTREAKTSEELKELSQRLKSGIVTGMKFPIDDDMIGTGTSQYNQASGSEVQPLNQEGINFKSVPENNPSVEEVIKRFQELEDQNESIGIMNWYDPDRPGVTRLYDNRGNMKPEYITTMLFLINNSLYRDDKSNILNTVPVIPIDIDMTIDGVGGLKPFDLFMVDYLPKIYREFCYFQIFDIGHTITSAGWETNITAKMRMDMKKYFEKYPEQTKSESSDIKRFALSLKTIEELELDDDTIQRLIGHIESQNSLINFAKAKLFIRDAYDKAKEGLSSFTNRTTFKLDGFGEITGNEELVIVKYPTSYKIQRYYLDQKGQLGLFDVVNPNIIRPQYGSPINVVQAKNIKRNKTLRGIELYNRNIKDYENQIKDIQVANTQEVTPDSYG